MHTAKGVKNWFISINVQVLSWASKSPDLNVVENIQAILVVNNASRSIKYFMGKFSPN